MLPGCTLYSLFPRLVARFVQMGLVNVDPKQIHQLFQVRVVVLHGVHANRFARCTCKSVCKVYLLMVLVRYVLLVLVLPVGGPPHHRAPRALPRVQLAGPCVLG